MYKANVLETASKSHTLVVPTGALERMLSKLFEGVVLFGKFNGLPTQTKPKEGTVMVTELIPFDETCARDEETTVRQKAVIKSNQVFLFVAFIIDPV